MSLPPSLKTQTMITVDEETQRLDSYSLPPSSEYECTMMEDFTVPLECNTELISYCAETQVIDYSEEDERTVVLDEDGDEVGISDADGASSLVVDGHNNQRGECEGEDATLKNRDGSVDVYRCSGSGKRSFADFRVASFRATISSPGHKMSRNFTTPKNSSLIRLEDSYKEKLVNEMQSSMETQKDDEMHFNCGDSNQKISRKLTARKLFDEQPSDEEKKLSANETMANVGELPGTLGFENSVVGLSYVNSQQPSDFSQSNALKAVETFLSLNDIELSQNGGLEKPGGLKVPPASSFNGIKLLAKTSYKSRSEDRKGGTDAFDWFDVVEDESGGVFFTKMKESIFVDQANAKKRRKRPPKSSHIFSAKNGHSLDSGIYKKDTVHSSLSRTKRSFSDTRTEILSRSSKSKIDAEPVIVQHMDAEKVESGMYHIDDVGPDTQMAAEAMEALAFVPSSQEINKKASTCVGDINGSNRSRITKKRSVRHASQQKIVCSVSDFEGSLRRSKRLNASTIRFKNGSNLIPSRVSHNVGAVTMIGEEPIVKKAKNAEDKKKKIVKSSTTIKKKVRQKKGGTDICEMGNDSTCFNGVKISLDKECLHTKAHSTQVCWTRQTRETRSLQNPDALFGNNSGKIKYFENSHTANDKGCTFDLNVIQSKKQETASNDFEIDEGLKNDACKTYSGLEMTTIWHPKRRRTNLTVNCTEKSSATINSTKSTVKSTVKSTHMQQGNTALRSSQKEHIQSSETPYSSSIHKINTLPPVCTSVDPLQIPKSKKLLRSSVARELNRLEFKVGISGSALKDTRKRKDISMVRPLFSRHLGDDIIKQQKKILARFRITIVSSISDATHFITNKFIRTKNMLEAMALGKPVVTHLWLESCGQAGCYIDEKNYILRDFKAEKDAGFTMPVSLAHSSQSPLLQDKQIFITPNVKPDRNTVSVLVKASGGQPLERTIRLDKNVPGDFFVISCEEDYRVCIPLLEKGAEIFSSELILNGIVSQKLQYERHRLFSHRS